MLDSTPNVAATKAAQLEDYKKLFGTLLDEAGSSQITWSSIEDLPENAIVDYENCTYEKSEMKDMLSKLVIVKLNGGLGTSMGCNGPKSLITVRNGKTFLDLTVEQISCLNRTYDVDVPLVLMNSFNTQEETLAEIAKYKGSGVTIHTFEQSCFPRISQKTLMPLAKSCSMTKKELWYPPGHGDFYASFKRSGLLASFLKEGKVLCFVSNIDNLGARVDFRVMTLLHKHSYVMEVTEKTLADVKGGTLVQYKGHLRLLEVAQVPNAHVQEFQSITKFKTFNTNNVWLKLDDMAKLLNEGSIEMEVILNPKSMEEGQNVYQLETAIGAAMKCFDNAVGVKVPRLRFLPVKKTSDLLLVMSDLYTESEGTLRLDSRRLLSSTPIIKLDDHFKKVKDFLERFRSVPSLRDLEQLVVSGNVTFGKNIILAGKVIIAAEPKDQQLHIPDNCMLSNKTVHGRLQISES